MGSSPLYSGLNASTTKNAKMTLAQAKKEFFNKKFNLPSTNHPFRFSSGNPFAGYVNEDDPNNTKSSEFYKNYKSPSTMQQVSINDLKKMGFEVVENEAQAEALQAKFDALYGEKKIKVKEKRTVNNKEYYVYHLGIYKIYAVSAGAGTEEEEEEDTSVTITFDENNKSGVSQTVTKDYEDKNVYAEFDNASDYGWGQIASETMYKNGTEYNPGYKKLSFKNQEGTTYKAMNNHIYSYQGWNLCNYATIGSSRETMFGTFNRRYATNNLTSLFVGYDAYIENGYDTVRVSPYIVNQDLRLAMSDAEKTSETKEATVYAIWDAFPVIREDAGLLISKERAKNFKTDNELINYIKNHFIITDQEDDANGDRIDVNVSNISLKEVNDILDTLGNQQGEIVSYTVTAKDSTGNETLYEAELILKNNGGDFKNDNNNLLTMSERYVRFINEDFYRLGIPEGNSKGIEELLDEYHNLGTLNPRSKWYLYDDYKLSIEDAFSNLKNDTPQETWEFKGDTALEVKNYIVANGFAKRKSENALTDFYNEFKNKAKK